VPSEPAVRRAVAFVDAQNLFHAAREAFGCRHPNFDALKLSQIHLREERLGTH